MIRIAMWFALFALVGCGGGSGSNAAGSTDPAVTGFGAAQGAPATADIGPAGGALATADGSVKLTFPAGALTATTTFTLQPVEDLAPGGVGPAFELTPRDVALAKPVSVEVLVPATALLAGGSTALSVARQGTDGAWSAFQSGVDQQPVTAADLPPTVALSKRGGAARASAPAGVTDSRVTVLEQQLDRRTTAIYSQLILTPTNASVHTGKTVTLEVASCDAVPKPAAAAGQDDLVPLTRCKTAPVKASSTSAAAGTLVEGAAGSFTYTAPGHVPSPNPVALTFRYDRVGGTAASVIVIGQVNILGDVPQSYSGKVSFTGTVSQLYEIQGTIDVDFALVEVLPGDLAKYKASAQLFNGTATLMSGCLPVAIAMPEDGFLEVFDVVRNGPSDPFAGKYVMDFVNSGNTLYPLNCGGAVTPPTAIPVLFGAECNDDITQAPSWSDNGHLKGSADVTCKANGVTIWAGTTTWDLTTP